MKKRMNSVFSMKTRRILLTILKLKQLYNVLYRNSFLRIPIFYYINVKRVIADRLCELAFLPDGLTNSINEIVFVSRFLFLEMKKLIIT